jgi:hypothetical protein
MVSATRRARLFLLALAAVVLSGCASSMLTRLTYANASLAYNNLSPMLTWTVDGYLDLKDVQEDWVRARLSGMVEWHRKEELPQLRRYLENALAKTAGPFTAEEVAPFWRELRAHYYKVVEHAMPDMAELLLGLDAEQATQLERKFADDNEKYQRDSLRGTPDERRRKRMRRFLDHLEAWVGSLDDEQREIVEAGYRDIPDLSDEILGERRFRQGEIMALVRAKGPADEAAVKLKYLLVEAEKWRRAEYVDKIRARDKRAFELLANLSAKLNDDQRAALQKRIRGFIRDIDTLTRPR